jgi:hypothetical protein
MPIERIMVGTIPPKPSTCNKLVRFTIGSTQRLTRSQSVDFGLAQDMGRFRWVAGQRFDASDLTGKFGMVDIRAVKALKRPVTLAAIRANPGLTKMGSIQCRPLGDSERKSFRPRASYDAGGAALAGPLARNFECLMDLLYSS